MTMRKKMLNTNSRKYNKNIKKIEFSTIHGKGKMVATFQPKSLYF